MWSAPLFLLGLVDDHCKRSQHSFQPSLDEAIIPSSSRLSLPHTPGGAVLATLVERVLATHRPALSSWLDTNVWPWPHGLTLLDFMFFITKIAIKPSALCTSQVLRLLWGCVLSWILGEMCKRACALEQGLCPVTTVPRGSGFKTAVEESAAGCGVVTLPLSCYERL